MLFVHNFVNFNATDFQLCLKVKSDQAQQHLFQVLKLYLALFPSSRMCGLKKKTKKLEIAEHHDACVAVFYLVISKVSPGLTHHPAKFEVNRCNGLVAIAKNKFLQHTMTDATSCTHRCHITSNLP